MINSTQADNKTVAVIGATGYIGARLVPKLIDAGWHVRAIGRNPEKLNGRSWSKAAGVKTVCADVFEVESLEKAVQGCSAIFYLVHSMNPQTGDFAQADRMAAINMTAAAEKAGVKRIVYLAGLGDETVDLSHHLQSRREVEDILKSGNVPLTVFRAAMIVGSGSASFEILRYLVERLPVMITPRWVSTQCQPIAVRNVLHYLVACLNVPETTGKTFDIGTEEIVTYADLMRIYAEEAGLAKRWIIPVPVLTPKLSSYWIHLVTPIPASLAQPLAEGLRNPVLCRETKIREYIPQKLLSCREAISLALEKMRLQQVETSWMDAGEVAPVEWSTDEDPSWAGGTVFRDNRKMIVKGSAEQLWPAVIGLGGKTGWYYANWLWKLRGAFDRLIGGPGLGRGRRNPHLVQPGDALDFWRVLTVEENQRLKLVAEMILPGEAVLEVRLIESAEGTTEVQQCARFKPHGLSGLLYWYAVLPFHNLIFTGMMKGIARVSGAEIVKGPDL